MDARRHRPHRARRLAARRSRRGVSTTRSTRSFTTLVAADIPAAPVKTIPQVAEDPHLREREMLVKMEDPVAEEMYLPGATIKMSKTPGRIGPVPTAGSAHRRGSPADIGLRPRHPGGTAPGEGDRLTVADGSKGTPQPSQSKARSVGSSSVAILQTTSLSKSKQARINRLRIDAARLQGCQP
jgi:hypothetical protein